MKSGLRNLLCGTRVELFSSCLHDTEMLHAQMKRIANSIPAQMNKVVAPQREGESFMHTLVMALMVKAGEISFET